MAFRKDHPSYLGQVEARQASFDGLPQRRTSTVQSLIAIITVRRMAWLRQEVTMASAKTEQVTAVCIHKLPSVLQLWVVELCRQWATGRYAICHRRNWALVNH